MIRLLTSVLLIPLLIAMTAPGSAWAADPSSLQLKVVEGDGASYPPGSRATRGVTVEVRDETGRLVEGATVGFTLPMTGPGGEFAAGGRSEVIVTRGDGLASAWGMRWNRVAGPFEVRVTAVKGQAHAEATVRQFLSGLPQSSSSSAKSSGGGGGGGGSSPSTAASAATGVTIGTPTISVGRP